MCIIIIGQGFSAHKVAAVATYKNRCQQKKKKKKEKKKKKKKRETHTGVMCNTQANFFFFKRVLTYGVHSSLSSDQDA